LLSIVIYITGGYEIKKIVIQGCDARGRGKKIVNTFSWKYDLGDYL